MRRMLIALSVAAIAAVALGAQQPHPPVFLYAAVGEELVIGGIRFSVVGVMETKLQIANYNRPDNECLFIPYDTYSLFGDIRYPWFLVWKPVSPEARDRAVRMVRAKLGELHRFSPKDEKAVEIMPFSKFMSIITGMSIAVKLLLGFVGSLTLASRLMVSFSSFCFWSPSGGRSLVSPGGLPGQSLISRGSAATAEETRMAIVTIVNGMRVMRDSTNERGL